MLTPLVVSAPTGTWPWAELIPDDGRDSLVLQTPGWEVDHLRTAATVFDRFVFVKESTTILDPDAFWAAIDASGPAWLFAYPSCYTAVYDSAPLLDALPSTAGWTKADSIAWEGELQRRLPWPVLWPEVDDWHPKRTAQVDGRTELVIGNDVVEKCKGTAWCGCEFREIPGICPHFLALVA